MSEAALRAQVERLEKLLDLAKDYVAVLEGCQDGYYRAHESDEAIAYMAAFPEEDS